VAIGSARHGRPVIPQPLAVFNKHGQHEVRQPRDQKTGRDSALLRLSSTQKRTGAFLFIRLKRVPAGGAARGSAGAARRAVRDLAGSVGEALIVRARSGGKC
jgi:hypothetical protein